MRARSERGTRFLPPATPSALVRRDRARSLTALSPLVLPRTRKKTRTAARAPARAVSDVRVLPPRARRGGRPRAGARVPPPVRVGPLPGARRGGRRARGPRVSRALALGPHGCEAAAEPHARAVLPVHVRPAGEVPARREPDGAALHPERARRRDGDGRRPRARGGRGGACGAVDHHWHRPALVRGRVQRQKKFLPLGRAGAVRGGAGDG